MKKCVILLLILCISVCNVFAQKRTGRNQSFYRHIDMESGNIFSLAAFSLAGGLLNKASDKLCKNAFLVTPITAKANSTDLNVENYKWNHLDAEDLFKDVQLGGRLGYQSQRGMFNAGCYASLHYRINQFKVEDKFQSEYLKHNIHRIMPGINAVFVIGEFAGIENSSSLRTYIEVGLRYAIVTKYENPYNLGKKDLNNGLVSHFAVYLAPNRRISLQDIGIFVDINHYDLIKDKNISSSAMSSLKTWTLGIQFSITQRQAELR